jgi:hypothetical protein
VLYVAVNKVEPNRRDATVLKLAIVVLAIAAILAHLTLERPVGAAELLRKK